MNKLQLLTLLACSSSCLAMDLAMVHTHGPVMDYGSDRIHTAAASSESSRAATSPSISASVTAISSSTQTPGEPVATFQDTNGFKDPLLNFMRVMAHLQQRKVDVEADYGLMLQAFSGLMPVIMRQESSFAECFDNLDLQAGISRECACEITKHLHQKLNTDYLLRSNEVLYSPKSGCHQARSARIANNQILIVETTTSDITTVIDLNTGLNVQLTGKFDLFDAQHVFGYVEGFCCKQWHSTETKKRFSYLGTYQDKPKPYYRVLNPEVVVIGSSKSVIICSLVSESKRTLLDALPANVLGIDSYEDLFVVWTDQGYYVSRANPTKPAWQKIYSVNNIECCKVVDNRIVASFKDGSVKLMSIISDACVELPIARKGSPLTAAAMIAPDILVLGFANGTIQFIKASLKEPNKTALIKVVPSTAKDGCPIAFSVDQGHLTIAFSTTKVERWWLAEYATLKETCKKLAEK